MKGKDSIRLSAPSATKGTGIGDAGEKMALTDLGFVTTPSRSAMMRKIKSTNTKAEVLLGKELWRQAYGTERI